MNINEFELFLIFSNPLPKFSNCPPPSIFVKKNDFYPLFQANTGGERFEIKKNEKLR